MEDERSAVLHAAGFESPTEMGLGIHRNSGDAVRRQDPRPSADLSEAAGLDQRPRWTHPPEIVRQMLGKVGIVTLHQRHRSPDLHLFLPQTLKSGRKIPAHFPRNKL